MQVLHRVGNPRPRPGVKRGLAARLRAVLLTEPLRRRGMGLELGLSLRLKDAGEEQSGPAPTCTTCRTFTGGTRVLDPADTTGRQPRSPKQQCQPEPTGRSILIRSSSWPALHIRDPDNTIVDRNRLDKISAASQLRLCCETQLGFSTARLGITAVRNYAVILGMQP